MAQDGSLPPTGRGGARPLQGIGGVRGEVRSPRPTEAPQVVPSIRADVGIGPYETGGKSPHPPGQRRTAKRLRRGREGWVGIGAGIIPEGASSRGQSLSHGYAVTAPVVPKAWPPPTKRRWRLGRRSRCPKFFARIRSQNFDRCHSFLLAFSATGGARKRPPLHKGAFGDGGCGLPQPASQILGQNLVGGGYAIGASARWASSQ